jgi:hypothetical protein
MTAMKLGRKGTWFQVGKPRPESRPTRLTGAHARPGFALQNVPGSPYVSLGCSLVPDRKPKDVTAVETPAALSDEDLKAVADYLKGSYLLQPSDVVALLHEPALDPDVREALVGQLNAWIRLADFAKWLSIGLAIGSGLFSLVPACSNDVGRPLRQIEPMGAQPVPLRPGGVCRLATRTLRDRPSAEGIDEWAPAVSWSGRMGGGASSPKPD